jgi:hypothetical protein
MTSDILEELLSADPEDTPSAAKIIMTRAAAEIEQLREHQKQREALMVAQQGELARLHAALDKLVQASLTAYHESEAAIAAAKAWQDAIAAARTALKERT